MLGLSLFPKRSFSLALLFHFILLHHKNEESKTVMPFFYHNEDLLIAMAVLVFLSPESGPLFLCLPARGAAIDYGSPGRVGHAAS